jgi:hypothetical protein
MGSLKPRLWHGRIFIRTMVEPYRTVTFRWFRVGFSQVRGQAALPVPVFGPRMPTVKHVMIAVSVPIPLHTFRLI